MTKAPKDPNAPTLTQESVLASAVYSAYSAGWDGKLGAEHAPKLSAGNYQRVGVPRGTREAAYRRGLVDRVQLSPTSISYAWPLTAEGLKVGEAYYEKKHGRTAKMAGREIINNQKARTKRHADRKKKAKHLFRGLHISGMKRPRAIRQAQSGESESR